MPIVRIPSDEYEHRFEKDPYETARNFLCLSKGVISPFLPDFNRVASCIDTSRLNPFNDETMMFDPDFICNDSVPRYMHIDYGPKLNGTGVSMCHVTGFKKTKILESDIETEVKVPFIEFDFLGKIFAAPNQCVELPDIRELIIYELSRRGFFIKLISFDGYQSMESQSILINDGYACDRLSIDRTQSKLIVDYTKPNKVSRVSTNGAFLAAWDALRESILDKRIKMPYHSDFEREVRHAERRVLGSKVVVQSPSASLSLDLLESMAGSIYNTINNERLTILYDDDIVNDKDMRSANFYKQLGRTSYDNNNLEQSETDNFYDNLPIGGGENVTW
jgi:hypothetical protein